VDIFMFLLAIMSNRSLAVEGFHVRRGRTDIRRGNAYLYHPTVYLQNPAVRGWIAATCPSLPFQVPWFSSLFKVDFAQVFESKALIALEGSIYSSILYIQPQMAAFARQHFGLHALYFLSNFLIRIPKRAFKSAARTIARVPRSIFLMGVHVRLQYPGQFYSYSVDQTMAVVLPFLKSVCDRRPAMFAFASDSLFMEAAFRRVFRKRMIVTGAVRKADFDHESALVDLAFLQMCDECLLSFRSTFSFSVAAMRGTPCYFTEKQATGVFRIANSQAGAISMLFHAWDANDWQTARRFRVLSDQVEETMRFFYRFLIV
jgi:hypothetical protein